MTITSIDWRQRAQTADLRIRHFIEGNYADTTQGDCIEKYTPRDGSLLYQLPVGTPEEMDEAISSARQAYQDKRWRGLSLHQRQSILCKLADLIELHQETSASI